MTETINKGDRVIIRGIIGTVHQVYANQVAWDAEKKRVVYSLQDPINIVLSDASHCSRGVWLGNWTISEVWPYEITLVKRHETTEKQQYTGEWGGQAAMTITYGDKVRIRGIEGCVERIQFDAYGDKADVTLCHEYEAGGFYDCDHIELENVKFSEIQLIKEDKTEDNTMSNIKVTQARIDHLMNTAKFEVITVFGKCTVVAAQFENGFILVESSACVDPANYDKKQGEKFCKDAIRERLWELEGYALQKGIHKLTQDM